MPGTLVSPPDRPVSPPPLADHGRSCCTSPAADRKSNVDKTLSLAAGHRLHVLLDDGDRQREHRSGRHGLDVDDVGLEVTARRWGDAHAADRIAPVVREALIDALGADDEPAGGRLVTVGVRGDELVSSRSRGHRRRCRRTPRNPGRCGRRGPSTRPVARRAPIGRRRRSGRRVARPRTTAETSSGPATWRGLASNWSICTRGIRRHQRRRDGRH